MVMLAPVVLATQALAEPLTMDRVVQHTQVPVVHVIPVPEVLGMTDLAAPHMKVLVARYIPDLAAPHMMVLVARHIPAPAAHVMRVQVGRAIQALVGQAEIAHQYADNTIPATTIRIAEPLHPGIQIPTKESTNRRIRTDGNNPLR
jgi:hypothetical protein